MQIHFFLQSSALRVPHSFHTEKKKLLLPVCQECPECTESLEPKYK